VGNGFSVPTSELTALLPEEATTDTDKKPTYTMEAPGKPEVSIQPSEEASPQLLVSTTTVPGTYRIRQTTPMKEGKPAVTQTLRVVEVPAIESQLRNADQSRLTAAAMSVQANIYTDIETLQSDDRTRRHGREIWRWLLVALLVIMIAELLLQQRSIRASVVGAS
jgi:hypothetical protein